MGPDLKQLAFDQGNMDDLNTEDLMLARIKSLALTVQQAAVHTGMHTRGCTTTGPIAMDMLVP